MRTSNACSWVLGTVLLAGISNAPSSTFATPLYAPLVAGNTDFALNLLGQLAPPGSGNVCFSPYSISACFGMVYAGARGDTALQMAGALDWSTNVADVGPEFGALGAELAAQQSSSISLNVANGLWAQTNFPFLPAFVANASANFDANVQQGDFITEAPQIAGEINDWVANETDGMISNLLQPGALNASTRLALVNAIYFKGTWESVFDTNATMSQPFYVAPGDFVYAPMMSQTERVPYYGDSLLQAIELPYTNSALAMVILLPNNNGPLALTAAELSAALSGMAPRTLTVELPKFKLETTIDLVPLLEDLGMEDAFLAGAADFSGIDGGEDLFIASATHKAVVEVDETGTVAAGATVITLIPMAVPEVPVFQANHPFVFLICDTNSGSILFLGQVNNPGGSAASAQSAVPLIQMNPGSFGIRNRQFGFTVVSTNGPVMVEACTNLAGGSWFFVQWLTPTNGAAYFSEPIVTNSPGRYYRLEPVAQ